MRLSSSALLSFFALALPVLAAPFAACRYDDVDDEIADRQAAWQALHDDKSDNANSGCSGVVVPDQGPFGGKVHLSFDDGPNPASTPKIMETLRRHNAPATFFINGRKVDSEETRAIVEEIVDDPLFTLANHTWSHQNMARLSLDEVASQIDSTTEVILRAGGAPRYFRFPFGSSTCDTMEVVHERENLSVGWHVDSADWCFAKGDGVCEKSVFEHVPDRFRENMGGFVMQQLRRKDGGIVLFHDIHPSTERALEDLLSEMEAEDLQFVALDAASFPLLHGEKQTFVGDACQTDAHCNFPGGFCLPEASGGYCTLECASSCPDRAGYATTRCVVPPIGVSGDFQVCAESCVPGSCREGLSCQDVTGANGLSRAVCF